AARTGSAPSAQRSLRPRRESAASADGTCPRGRRSRTPRSPIRSGARSRPTGSDSRAGSAAAQSTASGHSSRSPPRARGCAMPIDPDEYERIKAHEQARLEVEREVQAEAAARAAAERLVAAERRAKALVSVFVVTLASVLLGLVLTYRPS